MRKYLKKENVMYLITIPEDKAFQKLYEEYHGTDDVYLKWIQSVKKWGDMLVMY